MQRWVQCSVGCHAHVLVGMSFAHPLLYLSLFFKQHRQEYYEPLQLVRPGGGWLGRLHLFREGVCETARQAADTAARVPEPFDEDCRKIEDVGPKAASVNRMHGLLRRHPITTIPSATRRPNHAGREYPDRELLLCRCRP